ncbi:hypothetical protein SJAG_03928 [Schizosaccharomyces japonicus yFS275]|uniref:Uncharacterized protein n=1 Tax=Schizosaccharomyces japonicus (strain yFS275 / FY16936) TaxID=402676 RepID=B6K5F3_SCHJY|nr:hypothetical protein SJAG_03928 [Schizosaccharomyces japonicus yFS275]EEB08757.1 hypothetical protein SJAG_03928 [Schizosaccharomyces japonicus yFS275]
MGNCCGLLRQPAEPDELNPLLRNENVPINPPSAAEDNNVLRSQEREWEEVINHAADKFIDIFSMRLRKDTPGKPQDSTMFYEGIVEQLTPITTSVLSEGKEPTSDEAAFLENCLSRLIKQVEAVQLDTKDLKGKVIARLEE